MTSLSLALSVCLSVCLSRTTIARRVVLHNLAVHYTVPRRRQVVNQSQVLISEVFKPEIN